MTTYLVTTSMAGAVLPEGDSHEPFEATADEAIEALIDEAEFQLGDVFDDYDEVAMGDAALIEALRGHEGRTDLLFALENYGGAIIALESLFNSFGGVVAVDRV